MFTSRFEEGGRVGVLGNCTTRPRGGEGGEVWSGYPAAGHLHTDLQILKLRANRQAGQSWAGGSAQRPTTNLAEELDFRLEERSHSLGAPLRR